MNRTQPTMRTLCTPVIDVNIWSLILVLLVATLITAMMIKWVYPDWRRNPKQYRTSMVLVIVLVISLISLYSLILPIIL